MFEGEEEEEEGSSVLLRVLDLVAAPSAVQDIPARSSIHLFRDEQEAGKRRRLNQFRSRTSSSSSGNNHLPPPPLPNESGFPSLGIFFPGRGCLMSVTATLAETNEATT